MKILRTKYLIKKGDFSRSSEMEIIFDEIYKSISKSTWPEDSTDFTINPVKKGNGVKPIKYGCMKCLINDYKWASEEKLNLVKGVRPGPVDAVKNISGFKFAFEWETGNISSSHRALNKLTIGILAKVIIGGVLVLPSKDFYKFLTDRVGNYKEIEPYFPVWRNVKISDGVLAVIEIEHDRISTNVPLIPKGTDGRALK